METYLSIDELARYLGIAEKTVRKWVLNQDIPYHKIMKVIRFRLSEIERWIDGGKFPHVKEGGAVEGEGVEEKADIAVVGAGEGEAAVGAGGVG